MHLRLLAALPSDAMIGCCATIVARLFYLARIAELCYLSHHRGRFPYGCDCAAQRQHVYVYVYTCVVVVVVVVLCKINIIMHWGSVHTDGSDCNFQNVDASTPFFFRETPKTP